MEKHKLAWIFAIALPLLVWINAGMVHYGTKLEDFVNSIALSIFNNPTMGFILAILIYAIMGFVLGLIVEWIWSKLK